MVAGWAGGFYHARQPGDLIRAGADTGHGPALTGLVVDDETTRPDLRRYSEQMLGGSPAPPRPGDRHDLAFAPATE